MTNHCTCDNRNHEPWCALAEDFSRTAEMDALTEKHIAEKDANTARFDAVVSRLGSTPWGLWDKVVRNPSMTADEITDAIKAGRL